jgi:hypothetical protein
MVMYIRNPKNKDQRQSAITASVRSRLAQMENAKKLRRKLMTSTRKQRKVKELQLLLRMLNCHSEISKKN